MINVMVDLETLGKRAGCSILSIGAVMFDPETGELGDEFYTVIDAKSCIKYGLEEDIETVLWWTRQSPEARKVLEVSVAHGQDLKCGLQAFTDWMIGTQYPDWLITPPTVFGVNKIMDRLKVWGNGADFDNSILANAYAAVDLETPWRFYNNRCYRTLKNLAKVNLERVGTYHNALDDAKTQATHAMKLLRLVSGTPEPKWLGLKGQAFVRGVVRGLGFGSAK